MSLQSFRLATLTAAQRLDGWHHQRRQRHPRAGCAERRRGRKPTLVSTLLVLTSKEAATGQRTDDSGRRELRAATGAGPEQG
ncbi:MAG TPA: hypothetical protein VMA77_16505 [Solirubrobacteraceae bacterium]|nr:hypothetical protein [Solirubrobacteraceae bacterium]